MDREYKRLPFYVQKFDDEQGIVDAVVAVMGNIDRQADVIDPGSFRKTISERWRKIKILDNHNARSVRDVVGKPLAFREMERGELPASILAEYPDATGALFASIQFLLDTPEGAGVYRRIKSGAIDQYSIGYDALDTMPDTIVKDGGEQHIRRLKTIRLWEVSPCVFASNPATSTLAAKDDNDKQIPLVPVETAYSCECPKCNHKLESKVPCDEIKCPECGTTMKGKPLAVEPEKADVEPSEDKPAPEESETRIRIRVRDPADFQQDSFRVINIGDSDNGIQATIGRLKGETTTTVQGYIFDKSSWDVARAQSWVDDHKSEEVDVDEKGATGAANLPLAPRAKAWDAAAANQRVRRWADATEEPNAKYRRAFFWYDAENAENFTAYKLQFADIVGGDLQAVPRGVFAVAVVLQGGRGGVDIPAADKATIRSKANAYYAKMRREFDDEGITPPWEKGKAARLFNEVTIDETVRHALYENRWDIDRALGQSMESIIKDEELDTNAKVAMVDESLTQFHQAMLGWSRQAIAANLFQDDKTGQLATPEISKVLITAAKLFGDTIFTERVIDALVPAWRESDDEPEQKEGRVLARRNAERIGNALARLMEVFEDAGIEIPGFTKEPVDEEEKSKTAPDTIQAAKADGGEQKQDEAGPMVEPTDALTDAPPTFDSTSLLRAIEIELEQIQLVEV